MEYILIITIIVGITAFICYPFFAKVDVENLFEEDKSSYVEQKKSDLEILEEQKLELYSAIKEIEFDHGLGKLSEEDFKELRQKYVYEAAKMVSKIEALNSGSETGTGDSLEEEIKKHRNTPSVKDSEIEEEIKKHRKK